MIGSSKKRFVEIGLSHPKNNFLPLPKKRKRLGFCHGADGTSLRPAVVVPPPLSPKASKSPTSPPTPPPNYPISIDAQFPNQAKSTKVWNAKYKRKINNSIITKALVHMPNLHWCPIPNQNLLSWRNATPLLCLRIMILSITRLRVPMSWSGGL